MDKRIKHIDRDKEAALREELYRGVLSGNIPIGEAIKRMQKLSRMTQHEFAKHRGISVQALRQIQSSKGNPTVDTLNKVASIFGLQVGFLPKQARPMVSDEN